MDLPTSRFVHARGGSYPAITKPAITKVVITKVMIMFDSKFCEWEVHIHGQIAWISQTNKIYVSSTRVAMSICCFRDMI